MNILKIFLIAGSGLVVGSHMNEMISLDLAVANMMLGYRKAALERAVRDGNSTAAMLFLYDAASFRIRQFISESGATEGSNILYLPEKVYFTHTSWANLPGEIRRVSNHYFNEYRKMNRRDLFWVSSYLYGLAEVGRTCLRYYPL